MITLIHENEIASRIVSDGTMQELILKPDEMIVLQPGEQIEAGDQPLRIRFGLIDFTIDENGSPQQQLLDCIAQYLHHAAPTHWQISVAKHVRQLAELLSDTPLVTVIPKNLSWKRTARGRQHAVHEVDILVVGLLDTDSTVAMIDQWAELFLDGGGSLNCATCMDAATIDQAEAGYDTDALTNTPSAFVGGLRLTFWEL